MRFDKWITPDMASAGTLRWINKIRIANCFDAMDDLPRGNRGNPSSCVIANSVWEDCRVHGDFMYIGERKFRMPICAQLFVRYFDGGKMPELIGKSSKQLKKLEETPKFKSVINNIHDLNPEMTKELVEELVGAL